MIKLLLQQVHFNNIAVGNEGGAAIRVIDSNRHLVVDFCSFFKCSSSGTGGAVRLETTGGRSEMFKICAFECWGSQYSQFSIVSIGTGYEVNDLKEFSFMYCSPILSGNRRHSIRHSGGCLNIRNVNSTKNYLTEWTNGGLFYDISSFDIAYYQIADGKGDISLQLGKGANSLNIFSYGNFINNSKATQEWGLISVQEGGNFTISNSIFLINNNICFRSSDTTRPYIINCWISDSSKIGLSATFINVKYNTITILNNSPFYIFDKCNVLSIAFTRNVDKTRNLILINVLISILV